MVLVQFPSTLCVLCGYFCVLGVERLYHKGHKVIRKGHQEKSFAKLNHNQIKCAPDDEIIGARCGQRQAVLQETVRVTSAPADENSIDLLPLLKSVVASRQSPREPY
jgi:hypothetical protein